MVNPTSLAVNRSHHPDEPDGVGLPPGRSLAPNPIHHPAHPGWGPLVSPWWLCSSFFFHAQKVQCQSDFAGSGPREAAKKAPDACIFQVPFATVRHGLDLGGKQVVADRLEFNAIHSSTNQIFCKPGLEDSCENDDRRTFLHFQQIHRKGVAIEVRHAEVGYHHVITGGCQDFLGVESVNRSVTREPFLARA